MIFGCFVYHACGPPLVGNLFARAGELQYFFLGTGVILESQWFSLGRGRDGVNKYAVDNVAPAVLHCGRFVLCCLCAINSVALVATIIGAGGVVRG